MKSSTDPRLSDTLGTDLHDLQGIIPSGYDHLNHASYWFLHFGTPESSAEWLKKLIPSITTAKWEQENGNFKKPDVAINIAFTPHGLQSLGYPQDSLNTFQAEFLEGMSSSERSRRLGDIGSSDPDAWEIGGRAKEKECPIDILLIIQAPTAERLREEEQRWLAHHQTHGVVLSAPVQVGAVLPTGREHFGFEDGISQPGIRGAPGHARKTSDNIPAGEFVLGYLNAYEMLPATPTIPRNVDLGSILKPLLHQNAGELRDFGRNGTYLVFRKLSQNVAAFRKFVAQYDNPGLTAAKMVGRWPNGAPLVLSPNEDNAQFSAPGLNNEFRYHKSDPDGLRCPIGSHTRRANPRDGLEDDPVESLLTVSRHRIIRRGISYGEPLPEGTLDDDGKSRGLFFVCINVDIKRQFEFIQQAWINNPKFGGLINDPDPLIGTNIDSTTPNEKSRDFTIQSFPFRRRCKNLPQFVQMRGGGYFFLPSLSALHFLSFTTKPV